ELLGYSEVEQLNPYLGLDKYVGRFEIAVNDRAGMRVLHCFAHGEKQLEAPLYGAPVLAAVLGQRDALDIFHREPGSPVGKSVSVVEPRNEGMRHLGQRALLAGKAFTACGGHPRVAQEFNGDQASKVFTLREINHAHAAFTEHLPYPVRAE